MHIILASASPRRRELVQQIGWSEEICPASFAEAETEAEALSRIAEEPASVQKQFQHFHGADLVTLFNAYGKGKSVKEEKGDARPVVAADTVVVLGEQVLGKPKGEDGALAMLRLLSGKAHEVKTGLAVFHQGAVHLHVETTKVYFRELTEKEIRWYISTGEPTDKAGAYGIQGKGAVLVEKIEGSYDNVVGLPLTALYKLLIGGV